MKATSIAVGSNGAVWATSTNYQAGPGGYTVYEWTGSGWALRPGASGDAIAVDAGGHPWITNDGPIYTFQSTATVTAPAAPGNFYTQTESTSQVNLYWSGVSGATSYAIDEYINGAWKQIGTTTGTSYAITGLSPGSTYYFDVGASNSAGTTFAAYKTP